MATPSTRTIRFGNCERSRARRFRSAFQGTVPVATPCGSIQGILALGFPEQWPRTREFMKVQIGIVAGQIWSNPCRIERGEAESGDPEVERLAVPGRRELSSRRWDEVKHPTIHKKPPNASAKKTWSS